MRCFGISGIKLVQNSIEIEYFKVHSRDNHARTFLLEHFELWPPSKVKTMIDLRDSVEIIRFHPSGEFERGQSVKTYGDQNETLYTDVDDRTWSGLGALPKIE